MAAGQGFKTFTTGEVLTAADVNGYLMQGVGVFTDAANRDAEITSPQEGQFAYLKDTNVTTYYTGSAWANLDTTGMTNPMTTTGDTIYSSSGSTPARLGIGTSGQVLTVSGGVPTWGTPASGAYTLLSTTTLSGTSTTISSISQSYKHLLLVIYGVNVSGNNNIQLRPNNATTGWYAAGRWGGSNIQNDNSDVLVFGGIIQGSNASNEVSIHLYNYSSAVANKSVSGAGYAYNVNTGSLSGTNYQGGSSSSTAISSLVINTNGSASGTALLYGVN